MFGRNLIAMFFYGVTVACFLVSLTMPTTKMIGLMWIPMVFFAVIAMAFDERFDVKKH